MLPYARRLELLFLSCLPGIIALILAVFCLAPKHWQGLSSVMPLLPLMPVFYWGMLHAKEMPYWFVFLLGLVMDAVLGMPLALSSLLYIVFLALLHAQRKYIHKEGFLIKWGYFAALIMVISGLNWICLSMMQERSLSLAPPFIQWVLTVCCYPLFHKGFELAEQRTHERRWRILHGR